MKQVFLLVCLAAAWLAVHGAESPYGVCAHVSRMPEARLADHEFALMKSGGIDWVRTDFDWDVIQKKPGGWDYSHLDSLLRTAKQRDMKILPILGYDVKWAVPVYENLDQWREYVRRTVSRYAKELRYWEIWNEANHVNGPHYTRLNAVNYALLLKAAYEEIKKIDPELQVVYSGVAGVPVGFIEQTFRAGAAQSFDVMNIHPYEMTQQPEHVKASLDSLFALFKKYGLQKPVWVTEFSWPTHTVASAAEPFLRAALPKVGIDPETVSAAVIRDSALELCGGPEFPAEDFSKRLFPNRKEISYAELKDLDPARYPVLVPVASEAFPRKYFRELVEYVRRGGVLILCPNGFPFYYDARRNAAGGVSPVKHDSRDILEALHIDWLASWRDKVPAGGKVRPAPGIGGESRMPAGERYLSAKNTKPGDLLIPVHIQHNGDFSAPVTGIYKLDSDLKGAVLLSVIQTSGGVSQEVQGKFLPRAYLHFLAAGIDRIFWYKFLAEEQDPWNLSGHFGIVRRDSSPRDAFTAYRFLTGMHPAGSTRPVLKVDGNLYSCTWTRPDGAKVHAFWTVRGNERVSVPFEVREACDYLGRKLPFSGSVTASGGIVYLIEK